jgi:hypothetical protein
MGRVSSTSGINADLYNNTRCSFQRVSDAKIGHGWIETIDANEIIVRMRNQISWDENDETKFEIFGMGRTLRCTAKLSAEISAPKADVGSLCIFRIIGTPTIANGADNARLCNQDVTATVKVNGEVITPQRVPVQDVSRTGLAIYLPCAIEPGLTAELDLLTDYGNVRMGATIVVYSRLMNTEGYRHGFRIVQMGRLDFVNWSRIFERS